MRAASDRSGFGTAARYLAALAQAGIEAASFAADVRDRDRLLAALDAVNERFGGIDVLYYGAASTDVDAPLRSITETTATDARGAMDMLYPAIDAVGRVLPGMVER
ncbi:SDR family NAD(P)-dependent oxidoreductase [Nonomuraea sp. NPDC051191]|uniref:SDR family NAD(P)-dependent oxidoreductase n=1 Tax=Nonomuraea sp. NPDC051191 TaxID=3364372 RepID=UPI0037AD7D76